MKAKVDARKVVTFLFIIILSSIISYFIQPFIHGNEKAIDLIINVFSILAGFLVAIMTLFSDFSINNETNWRELSLKKIPLEFVLQKINIYFIATYLYLFLYLLVYCYQNQKLSGIK